MEILFNVILNPFTLIIAGIITALGFLASPFEINFEDGDEIEI